MREFLFKLKFNVKILSGLLQYAPCKYSSSWVLLDKRQRSGCQGDWMEYLFYSKHSDIFFYAWSDLSIDLEKNAKITEFPDTTQDRILKHFLSIPREVDRYYTKIEQSR